MFESSRPFLCACGGVHRKRLVATSRTLAGSTSMTPDIWGYISKSRTQKNIICGEWRTIFPINMTFFVRGHVHPWFSQPHFRCTRGLSLPMGHKWSSCHHLPWIPTRKRRANGVKEAGETVQTWARRADFALLDGFCRIL